MGAHPHTPVRDASAWTGADLAQGDAWIYRFAAPRLREIDAALRHARGLAKPLESLVKDDFPLDHLAADLDRLDREISDGRGFALLRGLDLTHYSEADAAILLWGLGTYFGCAISQNAFGDMLGQVRDQGVKLGQKDVRGYDSTSQLRFHNDECDIVGLLCLKKSKSGGLSSIVSSTQVFNEILAHHPQHLAQLFNGYIFSLMGEHRPGVGPVSDHRIPIFSSRDGKLSCRYTLNTIYQASQYNGIALTTDEQAALDCVLATANRPGMALDMSFEPGDIQLVSNHVCLHSRTEYVDHDEAERKRHLLRLWLAAHRVRPLAPEFEQRFNHGYSFRRGIPVTRQRVGQ